MNYVLGPMKCSGKQQLYPPDAEKLKKQTNEQKLIDVVNKAQSNEIELKSIRESLNAQIESFKNMTDGRLDTYHRKITYLWAESLAQDCPWIKQDYLQNDSNFSSHIDHLLDKLAASKIDLEEFKRSSFYLSTEKLPIKLEPIDSNFRKVKF